MTTDTTRLRLYSDVMKRPINRLEPAMQTKLHRNYFVDTASVLSPLYDAVTAFNQLAGVDTSNVLNASERAANASQRYRYNLVNAIRSVTSLQGDDLSVLDETDTC
jgi:hypothetical protein